MRSFFRDRFSLLTKPASAEEPAAPAALSEGEPAAPDASGTAPPDGSAVLPDDATPSPSPAASGVQSVTPPPPAIVSKDGWDPEEHVPAITEFVLRGSGHLYFSYDGPTLRAHRTAPPAWRELLYFVRDTSKPVREDALSSCIHTGVLRGGSTTDSLLRFMSRACPPPPLLLLPPFCDYGWGQCGVGATPRSK